MSPAEKRYFKRHYGSESNTLTHLYDAINQQKEYDEEAIKSLFTGKVAINLKVYKFQLEQLLLKSLASHRHFSTIGSKIRLGLEHFEILLEKNLTRMASKQLGKTKQICLDNEKFAYMPVILAKEAKLQQVLSKGLPTQEDNIHESTAYFAQKMMAHYGYAAKLNYIIDLYLKQVKKFEQEELDARIESIKINPRKNGTVVIKDQLIQDISTAIKLQLTNQKSSAKQAFHQVIEQFQKNKKYIRHFTYYYLISLRCAIDNGLQLGELELVRNYIKAGQEYCANHEPYFDQQMLFAAYEVQMNIQLGHFDFLVNELGPNYEMIIEEMELDCDFPSKFYFSWMSLASLFNGDTEKAVHYTTTIQSSVNGEAGELADFGRILEFVIYFETPDFQRMAQFFSRIRTEKAHRAQLRNSKFYQQFMSFADALATDPRSAKALATELRQSLAPVEGDLLMKLFFDFKLDSWLDSIINEKAFVSYFSERNAMDSSSVN